MSGRCPVNDTHEPETVEDVDEALVHLSAELYAAQVTGNDIRAEVISRFIDKALDLRLTLMGAA